MTARPTDATVVLTHLAARFPPERLAELLLEDWVGRPPWLLFSHLSSHTQLRQLNDLVHFADMTGCRVEDLSTVVEWGGGYGGMAKLFCRWGHGPTYVIIDFSLMSCVQWLYLATIFGPAAVHQITSRHGRIRRNKINLVPVCFLDCLRDARPDLFLSTFALNESSAHAQERVFRADWFGAKHLFLAYDARTSDVQALRRALRERGACIKRTAVGDGSFYACV